VERRKVGQLDVSIVGLGTNNFGTTFATPVDATGAAAVVHAALDAGMNFIDTADVYGDSEEFIGRALQGRRDEAVLATKFGGQVGTDPTNKGASAQWIVQAVEGSLRRLRTDRIDLYQLHFPDQETPLEETLDALDRLVRDGKVLEIGCSNFGGELIDTAATISQDRGVSAFASAQNDLSVLRSKALDDVVPACERHQMGLIPYGPLASGLLTGKYRRGEQPAPDTRLGHLPAEQSERSLSDRTFDRLDRLDAFARQHGHTLLELAFGWLLAIPQVVSVIAGATRPDQVRANAEAAGWILTSQQFQEATTLARA
jgi:aryl-alcohol dehydrogenase-like predicted oxidoreductase